MRRPTLPSLARWAFGFLAFLLVLLLAVGLVLPRWLQGPGARLAGEALGRDVSMAEVRFQPWRLGLVVEGLRIAGAPGSAEPLLSVARVDAALSLRSLWHVAPVLSSLTVEQAELRLARLKDGHYDIDDLLARFAGKPRREAEPADPADWAVYNIRLAGGRILLEDQPAGRRHELSELRLDLPFLSTLDAHVKQEVQPHISGRVNGAAFGSDAQMLPFAEPPQATLDFKLDGLDLAPYAAYLPADLPLRLQRGLADARLALKFGPASRLQLSGDLALREAQLQTRAGAPLLAWRELRVALKDVQPLRRQVQLGVVTWQGLELDARPDALPPPGKKGGDAKASAPWTFGLERFELSAATVDARKLAGLHAQDLAFKLGPLQWPLRTAVPLNFSLRLNETGRVEGEGSFSPEQLKLAAQVRALELAWFARHLPQPVSGQLDSRVELALARPLDADPASRAQMQLRALAARKLRLADGLADLAELRLDELDLDLATRSLRLGELALSQPAVHLARDGGGAWNLPAPAPSSDGKAETSPPWQARLRGLRIEGGRVQVKDAISSTEMAAEQIKLHLQNLAWPAKPEAAPLPVQLSLRVMPTRASARRSAEAGVIDWQGQLALAPLSAKGKLRIERLGLRPLVQPFLDPAWGVQLRRAELGLKGDFALQQGGDGAWQGDLGGDLLLSDLRLSEAGESGDNLLSWQALNLDRLKLTLAPGASPLVEAARARLNDFHARLVINEQGRFNLGELGPKKTAQQEKADKVAAGETTAPALRVAIGETLLSKGQVDFSDRFIRPNYSAELTELEGTLGAFATGRPDTATLNLRGRVAGTGLLQVGGQLNPGSSPPVMDIKAEVTDIELAPLSPYAAKYAGYAIERGKLSSRVAYKIGADGMLHADNQIILNQLSFGERVESPDATSLPVKLAVALLKDRNGVIDVNLPVSGSINAPDFSIGGLVGRMLLNLLTKAVTAPFSLLFPGPSAEQLGSVAFAPGSAAPVASVDKVAEALKERPALNLTITGWASERAETQALRERQLEEALQAERRRELRRQQLGNAPPGQPAAPVELGDADRARLLKQVYEASSLPNRPRNLLGMLKDIPPAEMRAMLLASYPVGEQRLRELAVQRGVAVRDALIAKGTPNARIFLATPRLTAADVAADWQPHTELTLGMQ